MKVRIDVKAATIPAPRPVVDKSVISDDERDEDRRQHRPDRADDRATNDCTPSGSDRKAPRICVSVSTSTLPTDSLKSDIWFFMLAICPL